jgi:hypothetical protein
VLVYRPTLAIGAWGRDPALDAVRLGIWLEALTAVNVEILRRDPSIPRLYSAGVRYVSPEEQCNGCDEDDPWADVLAVLAARAGDCEDLAAYLAAERRVRDGLRSRVVARREYVPSERRERIHCVTETHFPDPRHRGLYVPRVEDPSHVLRR